MKIMIVDDEEIQRITIRDDLIDMGYDVVAMASAEKALKMLETFRPDLIITDLRMPRMDGLVFLKTVKHRSPETEIILMTAYATVKTAVEAIQNGAFNYITKPFDPDELKLQIKKVEDIKNLRDENTRLREELQQKHRLHNLVGKSNRMNEIFEQIKAVAPTDTTVLITGPTGTGKEIVTDTIHAESNRADGPIVKVSCAILSREVLESELFGHERGAFTGAIQEKKGRFELAKKGTIYLDDVDDIPMDLQVKLLRVLQEKKVERVGGTRTISLDCRVIASTKYDLAELVEKKQFRSDLYYRFNVFPIFLPPLKDRKEDIPLLLEHFSRRYLSGKPLVIARDAMAKLLDYPWDGNIRELKNLVERLSISCKCDPVTIECLPPEFINSRIKVDSIKNQDQSLNLTDSLLQYEDRLIRDALTVCKGNRAAAARQLGIPVSTLKSKIRKLISEE